MFLVGGACGASQGVAPEERTRVVSIDRKKYKKKKKEKKEEEKEKEEEEEEEEEEEFLFVLKMPTGGSRPVLPTILSP
ncbi:hypothetical protein HZH68_004775 [Vespula germanica]|uniref:Uncharacterized protein n=1 Tax=Vespula germanica TaxID=30212 RepID=A0A834KM02_VESGE|nr:hypothetical protein HZH68_004775 [Vespula germanica]